MYSIAHLLDDAAVGGVNRMLDDQMRGLRSSFAVERYAVSPRRPLPPQIAEDVAVVHFTPSWSKLPFLMLLRESRGRRPIIHVEHTYTRAFERCCVPNPARFRRMLRLTYQLVDVVVAVSHGQAAWLREAGVVPAGKLVVIEPSVDCASLLGIPAPSHATSGPLRLAAYGRYCRQKGFDVLIEAVRRLPPERATLRLAGYGPDLELLQQACSDMPHVAIGGPVKDLGHFLAACDAVVVPSRWEAFGLVGLEARAAARSIVVSDVDGLSEQVGAATWALAVPEDPARLAHALDALAGSDVTAKGAAARACVAHHYQDHLHAWGSLLRDVATGCCPEPRKQTA